MTRASLPALLCSWGSSFPNSPPQIADFNTAVVRSHPLKPASFSPSEAVPTLLVSAVTSTLLPRCGLLSCCWAERACQGPDPIVAQTLVQGGDASLLVPAPCSPGTRWEVAGLPMGLY